MTIKRYNAAMRGVQEQIKIRGLRAGMGGIGKPAGGSGGQKVASFAEAVRLSRERLEAKKRAGG